MAIQTRPVSNNESYDRWQEEVIAAARDYRKGAWALADKLLEGMDRFGEAMFFQVVNDTGLSQHTVDNYLSLARAFPVSRRRENVSLSIHDAVRKLPDEEANAMLMLAEKYQWTREAVRDRVKAWKAGDLTALQAGWKPKLPAKIIEVEDDEPQEDDDKPVFDNTDAGAGMAAEKAERADFTASDDGQAVLEIIKRIERLGFDRRVDPHAFAASLSGVTAERLHSAATWLSIVSTEYARLERKRRDGALTHSTRAPDPLPSGSATGGTAVSSSPAVSPTHSEIVTAAPREASATVEGGVDPQAAPLVNSGASHGDDDLEMPAGLVRANWVDGSPPR